DAHRLARAAAGRAAAGHPRRRAWHRGGRQVEEALSARGCRRVDARRSNLCMADVLKKAVRVTFPKGASLDDPAVLFNTRLDSKTVRAIDFAEGDVVHEGALQALIAEAIRA